MAPISEKRISSSSSQQQQQHPQPPPPIPSNKVSDVVVIQTTTPTVVTLLKEGSSSTLSHHHQKHQHHQHAKENASSVRKNGMVVASSPNSKGLEILDFHESWMEEMEVYKDMIHVKKHVPHQLLGSHNHAHTPQGCQIEVVVNNQHQQQHHRHHSSANKMSSQPTTTTATATTVIASSATNATTNGGRANTTTSGSGITTILVNGTVKRRNANENKSAKVRSPKIESAPHQHKEGGGRRSNVTKGGKQVCVYVLTIYILNVVVFN